MQFAIQAGVAQKKKVSSFYNFSVNACVCLSILWNAKPQADANLTVKKRNKYFLAAQQNTPVDALALCCDKEVV